MSSIVYCIPYKCSPIYRPHNQDEPGNNLSALNRKVLPSPPLGGDKVENIGDPKKILKLCFGFDNSQIEISFFRYPVKLLLLIYLKQKMIRRFLKGAEIW